MTSTNSDIRKQGRHTLFFSSLHLCSLIQGGDSYASIKRSAGWHFASMSQLPSSPIPFPFHLSLSKSHVSVKAESFTFNTFFWPWQALFTWLEHCLGLSDRLPKQFPLFLCPKHPVHRTAGPKTDSDKTRLSFSAYLASTPKINMSARKGGNTLV